MKLAYDLYHPPEGKENKSLSPIIFLHGRLDSKKTESLKVIPPQSDETEAKKAIVAFIKDKLPPAQPQLKERGVFELDTMPIKKEGNTYAWQANLDALEDMLMSDKGNKQFSGIYEGDALFLYGTESFFNVKDDEDINKLFPRAIKVPIEGAGHLIHQDYPEEFLKHITDFILK
ncbi:Protein ABHD11 like protein [Argiope bruennichi]|uniref:Protein ABHD11 like protein n=1 Tax=Argiope bruennichi TaxID=94029 RepID=A0A8T0EBZ5_ARGBR|nr:Protein ABHD11 like protein [Argiope bruennichi]